MKTISILGCGSWGSALAYLLSQRKDLSIKLWDRNPEKLQNIAKNQRFLRPIDIALPSNVEIASNLEEACCYAEVELIICAIASEGVPSLIKQLTPYASEIKPLVSATKGLEQDNAYTMTQLWRNAYPELSIAALSGPNLSAEAIQDRPMRTVIASKSDEFSKMICQYFSHTCLRTEISSDLLGVEIAAAAKNVVALAAGAWDGLELGHSGKGCLISKAFRELRDLVVHMGGNDETVHSVAGLGDLFITCTSTLSRNYRTGLMLGQGKSIEYIQEKLQGQIAEGVWTTPLFCMLGNKNGYQFLTCEIVRHMLNANLQKQSERELLKNMFIEAI